MNVRTESDNSRLRFECVDLLDYQIYVKPGCGQIDEHQFDRFRFGGCQKLGRIRYHL